MFRDGTSRLNLSPYDQPGAPHRAAGFAASGWAKALMLGRAARRSARGRRGRWAMAGVWTIAALFLTALILYLLTIPAPGWFHPADPRDPEIRRLAQRVENRVITEAYRFRGEPREGSGQGPRATGEPWTIRISENDATAWLAVKLAEWLANRDPPVRLPADISELQAHFDAGRAYVGASVGARGEGRVVSVSAGVRIEGGNAWLVGTRAGVGRLSLPVSIGGWELLGGDGMGKAERNGILSVATGRAPLLKSGLKLEDGRFVRVLGVRLEDGEMAVECVTEVP